MGIVYFGSELQTCQCLRQVSLKRADHNKHQGLGVATEGELKEVSKLCASTVSIAGGMIGNLVGDIPCYYDRGCGRHPCLVRGQK